MEEKHLIFNSLTIFILSEARGPSVCVCDKQDHLPVSSKPP